jgi:hypothetical protein
MAIDSILANAASRIAGAIRNAAHSTGTSFEYLLTTARIESNLNPAAQATTTSAKGLYQFIEQTWLATMKQAGPALGYGQYANAISQGPDGRYQVADARQYAAIMQLRNDPSVSATMAGAFARDNAAQLATAIGRQPTEGELYIAHFLGHDGAARLIGAATTQPSTIAADLFPQAAAANRGIFYDPSGHARDAAQVYSRVTGRYQAARALAFAPMGSPDTAGIAQAFAQADRSQPPVAPVGPSFQSMFSDRVAGPVSRTVSTLWGQTGGAPPLGQIGGQAGTLDLFTDSKPQPRKLFGGV